MVVSEAQFAWTDWTLLCADESWIRLVVIGGGLLSARFTNADIFGILTICLDARSSRAFRLAAPIK